MHLIHIHPVTLNESLIIYNIHEDEWDTFQLYKTANEAAGV